MSRAAVRAQGRGWWMVGGGQGGERREADGGDGGGRGGGCLTGLSGALLRPPKPRVREASWRALKWSVCQICPANITPVPLRYGGPRTRRRTAPRRPGDSNAPPAVSGSKDSLVF